MVERGMVDRGRPSMRQLALRADLSVETVRRMIQGTAIPEVATLDAVAEALGVDPRKVFAWAGVQRQVAEPWMPPARAGLLSPKVRKALDQLILAITESEASSDAATMTPPHLSVSRDGEADVVDVKPRTQSAQKSTKRHPSR